MNYEDARAAAGGATLDQDFRDRTENEVALRVGYEVSPGYEAFVRGAVNERDYDSNKARESQGYETVAGVAMDITGKVRGEAYVGHMKQDYDSLNDDIDELTFGGNMIWNPTAITSVEAGMNRGVQETALNGSGIVVTDYSVRAEHEVRRNILVAAHAGLQEQEYEGAASNINERGDTYVVAGAEAKYLITRNFSASLGYTHTDRDSNNTARDYTSDVVLLKLSAAL